MSKSKFPFCEFNAPVLVDEETDGDVSYAFLECPMCGDRKFMPYAPVPERKRGMEMAIQCSNKHAFRVIVRLEKGRLPARLLVQTKTFRNEANVRNEDGSRLR